MGPLNIGTKLDWRLKFGKGSPKNEVTVTNLVWPFSFHTWATWWESITNHSSGGSKMQFSPFKISTIHYILFPLVRN